MSKEAMKLARKALMDCHYYMVNAGLPNQSLLNEAFTAYMELEAALAEQPAQQPCCGCGGSGWVPRDADIGTDQECFVCDGAGAIKTEKPAQQEPVACANGCRGFVKYPAQRTWVGLTDDEIYSVLENLQVMHHRRPPTTDSRVIFALAIEAKLKEKNT